MRNKAKLKKYLIRTLVAAGCIMLLFSALNIYEYHVYTDNFNQKLNAVVNAVREQYPTVTENELIEILNGKNRGDTSVLAKYGIDVKNDAVVSENDGAHRLFFLINAMLFICAITLFLFLVVRYDSSKSKNIADIIKTIEQINKRNYELDIDSISEDELSILKNEIYKTTVMLREATDNSDADKLKLKNSLEDISHQLKTPLTSILVMLDNMIDDPDMAQEVRNDFVRSIKRETVNINFFVQAILKLSRFDSNTIHFIKEKTDLSDIVDAALQNISALCDLRNVTVNVEGECAAGIVCDHRWQTEALTNILKNCVDHSSEGGRVVIHYSHNSVYSMIEVIDFGDGISKKDLPHVFERFYKGENAAADSTGIGLALSKSIIEEDNGTVSVSSDENGTVFQIKYFAL